MSTADSPHSLAGSRSQWRGRWAYRPAPSDGKHQETTWSHLWARSETVTQHSSSPSTDTTGAVSYSPSIVTMALSVDDLTAIGSAALVVLATAGSTNSVRTISAHLLTYGEQLSGVVILERRYGPRRLRDDDDDDDCLVTVFDCFFYDWYTVGTLLILYW